MQDIMARFGHLDVMDVPLDSSFNSIFTKNPLSTITSNAKKAKTAAVAVATAMASTIKTAVRGKQTHTNVASSVVPSAATNTSNDDEESMITITSGDKINEETIAECSSLNDLYDVSFTKNFLLVHSYNHEKNHNYKFKSVRKFDLNEDLINRIMKKRVEVSSFMISNYNYFYSILICKYYYYRPLFPRRMQ